MATPILIILGLLWMGAGYLYLGRRRQTKHREELKNLWAKPKENQHFNFGLISAYFDLKNNKNEKNRQLISDKTADDLHLHDLFRIVDRTTSRIGQQFLYYKLRAINPDQRALMQFDTLVEKFAANAEERLNVQQYLSAIKKNDAYFFQSLLQPGHVDKPKWYPLVFGLTASVLVLLFGAFTFPWFLILLLPVFICNLVVHLWNKQNIGTYTTALSEFAKAHKVARQLMRLGIVSQHFTQTTFLDKLSPVVKQLWFVRISNKIENDITGILYLLAETVKILFNLEVLGFFFLIDSVKAKQTQLNKLFCFIGEIDCAISVASLREGLLVFCKPVFGPSSQIRVEEIYHLLVDNCVPNSLELTEKSLLLTGSNMSGKTTFIRSVGVNMLLAQTLYTCMAKSYKAPFSRIFSSIGIADDLLSAKSYYLEEVTTIKQFIDKAGGEHPCLFILDEIFKGTNTLERIAAGKAILSYLAGKQHLVLVSTHDIELTELLQEQFDLYHFSESVINEELVFDHKIKKGPLQTRNAIQILELNSYPAEIVREARDVVMMLEKEKPKSGTPHFLV